MERHVQPLARTLIAVLLAIVAAAGAQPQRFELVVDAPAELAALARRVRGIDQAALAEALGRAGLPLPASVSIQLVPNGDPRAASTPEWVVGSAAGTRHIVIFPGRIGSYPHGSLESVVRHEIVHLALSTRAQGGPLPRWFHEGVAMSVESGWGARDEIRLLLAAFERPSISDLRRLFASERYPDTAQAYLLAAALVDDLRSRHGNASPGAIAAAVGSGLSFDAAFLRVTGERTDEVAARAWAGYRRVTRLIPAITSPSALWLVILAVSGLAFVATIARRREQRRRWQQEDEDADAQQRAERVTEPDMCDDGDACP